MTDWAGLAGAVDMAPELPDARCKGRHELFDPAPPGTAADVIADRTKAAKAICATCPALAACTAWVDTLSALKRPAGVTAGRKYSPPPTGRQGRHRTADGSPAPANTERTEPRT